MSMPYVRILPLFLFFLLWPFTALPDNNQPFSYQERKREGARLQESLGDPSEIRKSKSWVLRWSRRRSS